MAISVDPLTDIIYIPKADLTLVQASPEVRELDLNAFHLWLLDWEDDENNIYRPKTHNHSTEVSLAGLTYARIIEVLSPYTVEFEDGQYTVNCTGANHNLSDKKVANQVSLIINNAAGLITNTAIEYSSFNGGVTIDTANVSGKATSGTLFPIGTPQQPVDNIDDAFQIAEFRGFPTFYIIGDLTLDSSVPDLSGYRFIGNGMDRTLLTIDSDATVDDCEYRDATVTGTLDGNNRIVDCMIDDLIYVKGILETCVLSAATITLGGAEEAHFLDCWSGVPGTSTPTINMGGSGQALALRNYNGGIKIENKTGTEEVSIDLNSGQIILDSTVTGGTIVCRGIGKLTDNSNGATVLADDLLNYQNITEVNWEVVYIDTEGNGSSGTVFPIGTKSHPVDNITDAKTICEAQIIERIHIHGSITLNSSFEGYRFESHSTDSGSVNTNSQNINHCAFLNITVTGSGSGHINITDCELPSGYNGLNCHMENCILGGTFVCDPTSSINGDRCTSSVGAVFDLSGTGSIGMANWSGILTVGNVTSPTSQIGITGNYLLTLLDTCTNGVGLIAGIGIVNDYSSGLSVTERTLPHAVWNTILTASTYNLPTSAGRRLRQLSSSIVIEGEVVSSTVNTVTFDGDASSVDGAYDPALVVINDGLGVGQSRLVLEYIGSTKTAIVDRNWKIPPDATSKFVIIGNPGREHVNEGLAQGGTINTITLNALASSNDDVYVGQTIFIRSGTGEDQAQKVLSYNGTTKVATLCKDWAIVPDSTSAYVILPTGHFDGMELVSRTADAVWAHVDALAVMSDLAFVKKIEGGRWAISSGQMIFYDEDNITEIARFDITYDGDQNPVERTRV